MVYTLGEAARATGKSKATISKAIKSGRVSARKDETGTFHIDPSELHRVYPPTVSSEHKETPETPQKIQILAGLSGSYRHVLKRRMNAYPTRRRS
jgi:hypothetical protein